MNVRSKLDTEEEEGDRRSQYMRAGCGTPYSMFSGATRMDVSNLHPPKFIKMIFKAMGWKTGSDDRLER
jgi:hypothetical protein